MKRSLKALSVWVILLALCGMTVAASLSDQISSREIKNAELSRSIAAQGMVLLENNGVLPLSAGKVALFGGGAVKTVKGGTGSGDVNQRYVVSVREGFENAGFELTSEDWLDRYKAAFEKGEAEWEGGWFTVFSMEDIEVTDTDIAAAKEADMAVYVIARNSGEGSDRDSGKGDYLLTDIEYNNLKTLGENFENVVVVLNVGGIVDTKFFNEIGGLDSLLLMSQAGMEGGNAVVDILTGKVTPSGKLTDTWAVNYSDYQSSKGFSSNDGNTDYEIYNDGIYVGYRYFDTFNVTPAYEFGYGLSYTTFDIALAGAEADADTVTVKAVVTNTGEKYSGKEVVQVYFSAPEGTVEKPYQELAGFAKTDELAPGQSQEVSITFKTREMSSYDEGIAAYVMEKGEYIIRVGNSSRNTQVAAVLSLNKSVRTEQLSNQMVPVEALKEITAAGIPSYSYEGEAEEIATAEVIALSATTFTTAYSASPYDAETVTTYVTDAQEAYESNFDCDYEIIATVEANSNLTLKDVYDGKCSMEEFVAQLSIEALADIVNGIGWGGTSTPIIGAQSSGVPGAAGETTGKYFDKGIPNIVLSDGPAGIRITQQFEGTNAQTNTTDTYYQFCTAWPIGTLLAMTWDPEVIEQFGKGIGSEMNEYGVTLWLAPGMNIHRNPLCGRNFEYFSEDPLLSGVTAAAETKGIQSYPGIGVTLKHYVTNNQENNRSGENNIVSERALREIYLKGFEIAVKTAQPMAIMTSYNRTNGKYSSTDYDLCTDLPRGEWGFKGLIMTDWGNKGDAGLSMHAGNDVIMPGGVQEAIIEALMKVEPEFNEDGTIKVVTVTSPWGPSTEEEVWHDFVPDTNEDGSYVTKTVDGKTVYEGHYKNDYIVLGDLQKSAANTLNIIMQSSQMGRLFDEITAKSYSEQFDLQDQFVSDKSGVEKNMTSYTSITDIYDWGPAVTKVIVALGQTVNAGAIDKDTFSVYVTRIDDRFDHPAFDEGYRLIKKAYVSDENGKAVSSGDFVTLEMEVGPSITLSSPINYYTGGNLWIGYEMQIAQKKTIIDGETILSGIEAVNCVRQVRNLLDAFVFKQSAAYDGITYGYAEYTPKTDSKKNPLIIWLHGGGEGGTDPTIPITANKVVNLATPEIQTIFDGAYVLAPQAETYWMHSIGEGFANGTSIYEDSLMAFIRDYVAGNPDIDANRVYVGGCSNGGYMTMLLIRDYPEFFAASFPVCEGLNDSASVTDDLIQALKELSIWFVAAKTDRTLPPLNYSIPTYIRLREAGAEDVHMTLLEDVHDTTGLYKDSDGNAYEYDGHWSWVFVYNNECETLINGKITSLMEWLASHSL